MNKSKQAFTLVELIVVIIILAILWTIAFISLQWYSADARDSSRISDVNHIKTSLELFSLDTWKYPSPDNAEDVTYSGWTVVVWKQWTVWDIVTWNLSRNLNEKPTDPLYETEYVYSTLENGSKYEVMSVYEWDLAYTPHLTSPNGRGVTTLVAQTNAASTPTVRIDGTYNWLYVKTWNYIIPTPSIITSLDPTWLDFNLTTIASQVIDNGTNIPNIWTSKVPQSTWWLTFTTFEVYNGVINQNSNTWELLWVYNALANTYNGSSIANIWIIASLLTQTNDEEKIAFTETVVLSATTSSSSSWWSEENIEEVIPTWWMLVDPNCDQQDIHIPEWCIEWDLWCQIWAGCNSTLWNWFEFWQTDIDIWTENYSWTFWNCFSNYDWVSDINPWDACVLWNITMASDSKANTWFTWININWDPEVNNIWWKLYTWTNVESACYNWYHVATDEEWTILENYLISNNGNSDIWWKNYFWKTKSNNIVKALNIPLAGYRNLDSSFAVRGYYSFIWTNTSMSETDAYRRYLSFDSLSISRTNYNKLRWLSVRCIKDN